MAIHKSTISRLSGKEIERMSESRLNAYLQRAEKLLNQNIKQYEKPQKQWNGKSAATMFNNNYHDMKYVKSLSTTTQEEKQEKLKDISRMMRRSNYTPTQARQQLKDLSKGTYARSFENYIEMEQSERREIYEKVGSVFEHFTQEEISKIGSEEIVARTAKFMSKDLSYKEIERRAVISIKNYANKNVENWKTPATPKFKVSSVIKN